MKMKIDKNLISVCDRQITNAVQAVYSFLTRFFSLGPLSDAFFVKPGDRIRQSPAVFFILFAAAACANILFCKQYGFAAAFIIISWLSVAYPAMALALAAFLFPLDAPADLFGSFTVYTNELFLIILCAGALLNTILTNKKSIKLLSGIFLMLMFAAFALLPLFWVHDKTALFKAAVKGSEIFIMFFLASAVINDKKDFLLAVSGIVMGIFITTSVSFYQLIYEYDMLDKFYTGLELIPRLNGGMSVTTYSGYLNYLLMAAFLILFVSKNKILQITLFFLSSFIFASQLAFPYSRNGWIVLSVLAILSITAVIRLKIKMGVLKLGSIFLIALIMTNILILSFISQHLTKTPASGFKTLTSRTSSTFIKGSDTNYSTISRLEFYKIGLKVVQRYPLGVGAGNYKEMIFRFAKNSNIDPAFIHHMHNTYLHTLVTCGAGGLICLILIFIFLYYRIYLSFIRSKDKFTRISTVFTSLAFFGFMLGILLDSYTVFGRGIIFSILPGALFGLLNNPENDI